MEAHLEAHVETQVVAQVVAQVGVQVEANVEMMGVLWLLTIGVKLSGSTPSLKLVQILYSVFGWC